MCDGLTFFFAAKAMKFNDIKFNGYLYDSWSKFDFQEHKDIFDYSYLNVDTVKKIFVNLKIVCFLMKEISQKFLIKLKIKKY